MFCIDLFFPTLLTRALIRMLRYYNKANGICYCEARMSRGNLNQRKTRQIGGSFSSFMLFTSALQLCHILFGDKADPVLGQDLLRGVVILDAEYYIRELLGNGDERVHILDVDVVVR